MASSSKKDKTVHKHGCTRCRQWYEDCCTTTDQDGLCVACRGGIPMDLLIEGRRPRECCVNGGSETATKEAKKTYSLAGKTIWFQCRTCKRVFPKDPRNQEPFIPDWLLKKRGLL